MNMEQAMSLLRSVLIVVGSGMGATAIMTPEQWTTLSNTTVTVLGGLITIVPIVWGVVSKTNTGLVKAAASVPEVKKITAAPEVAQAVESPKVSGTRSHP